MKRLLIALPLLLLGTPANAADLGGSYKDAPYTADTKDHGGFAVRAFIMYSWGERDISQRNSAEAGLYATPKCDEVEVAKADSEETPKTCEEEIDTYKTELVDFFNANGVDASWDGTTFELPLVRIISNALGSDDVSTFAAGAEAEYLTFSGRLAIGAIVGATFYGDADSTFEHSDTPIKLGGGALISPHGSPLDGLDTGLTSSGFVSVERSMDIDLMFKLGWLVTEDTLWYVVGGPSLANFKIRGGVQIDQAPDLALEYEERGWALGYVVGTGIQHWLQPNWSVDLRYTLKDHSFKASGDFSASEAFCEECDAGLYARAKSESKADDLFHNILLGTAIHF